MQIVNVTADGVRRGDVVAVGGIPHVFNERSDQV